MNLPGQRSAIFQIEDLMRVEEFAELIDKLLTLTSAAPNVDEYQQRQSVWRNHVRLKGGIEGRIEGEGGKGVVWRE